MRSVAGSRGSSLRRRADTPLEARDPRRLRAVFAVTSPVAANVLLEPVLDSLRRGGFDVTIVCAPGEINDSVREKADVVHVAMLRDIDLLADVRGLVAMFRTLRRLDPDVLVAGTSKAALLSLTTGMLLRIPTRVLQMRGLRWEGLSGLKRRTLIGTDRLSSACATHVLSVSRSVADSALAVGAVRGSVDVIGAGGSKGFDEDVFYPDSRYSYDAQRPRLGFVGRLAADKGVAEAVELFGRVRDRISLATMQFVGDLDEVQPLPDSLMARMRTTEGLSMVPWEMRERMADRIRGWDLLVFPSRREGLPNAVIEAAACGVPTVGFSVTGVKDAVADGWSGRLAPPFDEAALLECTLASLDPTEHQRLRQGAVDWSQRFRGSVVSAGFVRYLVGVTCEPRRSTR